MVLDQDIMERMLVLEMMITKMLKLLLKKKLRLELMLEVMVVAQNNNFKPLEKH